MLEDVPDITGLASCILGLIVWLTGYLLHGSVSKTSEEPHLAYPTSSISYWPVKE